MKKIIKTLLIVVTVVTLMTLSACGNTGCKHKYTLLNKVDAVDCKTPGYADYECEKCGKHKHERLIIQHDCEKKDDYISIQYCKTCKQDVRLTPLGTIDEDFYYCYKDSMKEKYEAAIEACYAKLNTASETMSEKEKKALSDEVDELFGKMIDELYVLKDQYTASDVNFYVENTTETTDAKDAMEKMYNECLEKYRFLYYDCFHSPLQAYLFEGEDLEKIEKEIQNYKNPLIKTLEDEIDELEHDLYFPEDVEELTNEQFALGYKDLLAKRAELAKLYNYDNYYEYAHSNAFGRQYSIDQVKQFREYVVTYVPDLSDKYFNAYYNACDVRSAYTALLSLEDSKMFNNTASTRLYVDYLKYMSSDKLDFYNEVNNAFKDGRVYISTDDGVEAGFTTSILNDSVNLMFFYNGEYYSCPNTVVHETGHFMFKDYYNYNDYDLFEVQSQTNEFIFAAFLKENKKSNTDALIPYKLYAAYATMQTVAAVDEFEYSLYTNYSDLADKYKDGIDYTEYDSLYADICKKYRLDEVQYKQWHYYSTQCSCYAISYGISLVPAIAKYNDAKDNLEQAKADYIHILTFINDEEIKAKDDTISFNEALEYCNFANPFDEETFKNIDK